jgi:4-hydroxybenzoate polyprenyltransferase
MRARENDSPSLPAGVSSPNPSGAGRSSAAKLAPLFYILYLAGCGGVIVLAVQAFVGLDVIVWPLLPASSITLAIYLLNRHSDQIEDRINDRGGQDYFIQRPVLLYCALALLALTYGLLWQAGELVPHYLILLLVGVAYSCRLLPWWLPSRGLIMFRIKDLPVLKNLVVALLWGSSAFVLPLAAHDYDPWSDPRLVIIMCAISLSTWSNTFFNDVLDRRGDALAGNRTLAVRLGVVGSLRTLAWVNALWAIMAFALFRLGVVNGAVLLFLALLIAVPLLAVAALRSGRLAESTLRYLSEIDLLIIVLCLFLLH